MIRTAVIALLLLSGYATGQNTYNCGTTTLQLTGNSGSCLGTITGEVGVYTESFTYQDICYNTSGAAYSSQSSTVTGSGQCMPLVGKEPLVCAPINDAYVVYGTQPNSSTSQNQFVNDAYAVTLSGGGILGGPVKCTETGTFVFDYKYCAGTYCVSSQCSEGEVGAWCTGNSPIIFDTKGLAGGGFMHGFSDPKRTCVMFDINADGKLKCLSWPKLSSGLGWLALPDAHGHVSNSKQLFGNLTPQPNYPSKNPNGFLALAEYDLPEKGGNFDGVISNKDKVWNRLVLWIDKHCQLRPSEPCVARPEELHKLEEFGVTSISLMYSYDPLGDQWGNLFKVFTHINVKDDPQYSRTYA